MALKEDKLFSTEDPKASKRRFFLYAPPLKGVRPSKRKPPKAPFKGAKPWQVSVFYYWWEYLRRHEGYAETCRDGGKGSSESSTLTLAISTKEVSGIGGAHTSSSSMSLFRLLSAS